MKQLLLFPYNGNARETLGVVDAINRQAPVWDVLGFFDDDPARAGDAMGPHCVLGGREVLADYPEAHVVAVPGRPDNYWKRLALIESLGIPDARFATLVHPTACIGPECSLSVNTVLMAGVVLTASVRLGAHVGILPNTVLSHEVTVGQGTLIGANVVVAGGVQVGECCYIGSGSHILQNIILGDAALVGLGSTILHSVPPRTVVAGNPGKLLRALPPDP